MKKHNTPLLLDFVALCFAKKCTIHPILYNQFLSELEHKARAGKLTLVPISVFHVYNKNIKHRMRMRVWG